eukprot:g37239.t1
MPGGRCRRPEGHHATLGGHCARLGSRHAGRPLLEEVAVPGQEVVTPTPGGCCTRPGDVTPYQEATAPGQEATTGGYFARGDQESLPEAGNHRRCQ